MACWLCKIRRPTRPTEHRYVRCALACEASHVQCSTPPQRPSHSNKCTNRGQRSLPEVAVQVVLVAAGGLELHVGIEGMVAFIVCDGGVR
ncbi:hypothetical protein BIW11_03881 [Tropilaelaps mercedesae]|uniref:Uncharacterized protein n=1 Tax=Tropilaelaps mercedesae TaxID=418985 RepID=A0A1V9XEF4_9ACAR|nr:hypothetical protein BIW11_03881 [Tropilaelaps mercedesae]